MKSMGAIGWGQVRGVKEDRLGGIDLWDMGGAVPWAHTVHLLGRDTPEEFRDPDMAGFTWPSPPYSYSDNW